MPPPPPDRAPEPPPALAPWQQRMHEVIFEADTSAGKAFDVVLIASIVLSVTAVMLESVAGIRHQWGTQLLAIEWFFTLLFTAEYLARLLCVQRPWRYAVSFYGVVDLLAILPTYLSVLIAGTQSLLVIRALRLVRVFRVFKLAHHLHEARNLVDNLRRMRAKITVFLVVVLNLIVVIGALMYLIEGTQPGSKFTSIPRSIYWAIVTMTTVGYGDISPKTELGQALAAVTMILGYSIIIVPTGLFTVGLAGASAKPVSTQACHHCSAEGHDLDAVFCKFCGTQL
ncbi:MAG: ion transporter [Planctomycetales bacterium]|nr:ion transporter [Planctomycetales bacterium]